MEYGLIFHGTRTVKYYCKNMKYRINNNISREISIEHPSVGLASLAQLNITMPNKYIGYGGITAYILLCIMLKNMHDEKDGIWLCASQFIKVMSVMLLY